MNYINKIISKKIINYVCLIVLVIFFIVIKLNIAYSATAEELRNKIQEVTATRIVLEQKIAAYEQQLKDIAVQADSLKNTIKSLDTTINKNTLDIKLTQNNIDSTILQIEELSIDINKNISLIDKDTEATAKLIRQISTYDNTSFIENLFAYDNLSEFWNEQQNIIIIQDKIREKIVETKNTKVILEKNKLLAEMKKKDLLKLKVTLLDKKNLLTITKKEKNKLLSDTKNSETTYKKILIDTKALADAFNNELAQFESQLKFSLDINSVPSVGKGILSWPLNIVKITQEFGITDFSLNTNAYNGQGHNGVDFRATIGTSVKTALSGIVKGTGNTDLVCPHASFGQWVFIEHANGLSTIYAHLSLIKVSAGDIVATGDIVGYSGNTGYSTGPHLHFGVYATQGVKIMSRKSVVCNGTYIMPIADLRAYLDPLQYL